MLLGRNLPHFKGEKSKTELEGELKEAGMEKRGKTKAIQKRKWEYPYPESSACVCTAKTCVEALGISGITIQDSCCEAGKADPRMPSVSLSLPSALAGRARTWVCLSCMFWVRDRRSANIASLKEFDSFWEIYPRMNDQVVFICDAWGGWTVHSESFPKFGCKLAKIWTQYFYFLKLLLRIIQAAFFFLVIPCTGRRTSVDLFTDPGKSNLVDFSAATCVDASSPRNLGAGAISGFSCII